MSHRAGHYHQSHYHQSHYHQGHYHQGICVRVCSERKCTSQKNNLLNNTKQWSLEDDAKTRALAVRLREAFCINFTCADGPQAVFIGQDESCVDESCVDESCVDAASSRNLIRREAQPKSAMHFPSESTHRSQKMEVRSNNRLPYFI